MEFVTIFIAVLGIEYLWWVFACRRNRRDRKARMTAALRNWINAQRNEWTEADGK